MKSRKTVSGTVLPVLETGELFLYPVTRSAGDNLLLLPFRLMGSAVITKTHVLVKVISEHTLLSLVERVML